MFYCFVIIRWMACEMKLDFFSNITTDNCLTSSIAWPWFQQRCTDYKDAQTPSTYPQLVAYYVLSLFVSKRSPSQCQPFQLNELFYHAFNRCTYSVVQVMHNMVGLTWALQYHFLTDLIAAHFKFFHNCKRSYLSLPLSPLACISSFRTLYIL